MSSQKGNTARTRPQKHKNRTAFKNNLHDTSHRTKLINSIQVSNVCVRCKEIIEWKIKYKKYKPLTQPKKCVKCEQKTVKQAYHVMCVECGKKLRSCAKCCQSTDIVHTESTDKEQVKLDSELTALVKSLPERKRRTFIRYMNKRGKEEDGENVSEKDEKEALLNKLNALKMSENDDLSYSDFDESELDDLEDEDHSNNDS